METLTPRINHHPESSRTCRGARRTGPLETHCSSPVDYGNVMFVPVQFWPPAMLVPVIV